MTFQNTGFPFRRIFNLKKLMAFWEESARAPSQFQADYAGRLLDEARRRPELFADEVDPGAIETNRDLIAYLMTPVIPLGGSNERYAAVIPPFTMEAMYATETFGDLRLLENYPRNFRISGVTLPPEMIDAGKIVSAYSMVMEHLRGVGDDWRLPFVYTTDPDPNGLVRHFKIEFDTRFLDVKVKGTLPEASTEDLQRLHDDPMNLGLWTSLVPPHQIELHGFGVINAVDVTLAEELSALKDDLLKPHAMASSYDIDNLESRLRTILRRPDLRLGLMALERADDGDITSARPVGRSILMIDSTIPKCSNKDESFYMKAFHSGEPVIVNDLQTCADSCTGFEFKLMELGFRNIVIAPLHFEDEMVGLLEIASPNAGDVDNWNVNNLLQVRSLFATALNRDLEQREDRLQSIIKRQYTAIHPSVEWRFRDAAQRYLEAAAEDSHAEAEEIVFEAVHPMYGLSDIRGSSTNRVESIQADLLTQLGCARAVVRAAIASKPLPALDELGYQIEKLTREISSGITTGDEAAVLEFLQGEVEKRLDHLASFGDGAASAVQAYRDAVDPRLGIVYRKRKDFETSIQMINDRIARYLEVEQEKAQAMFPHYFERYLTDGVDYNIYVGASLNRSGTFDPLYLRNLRLWQLMTTCGIAWEMKELHQELPIELDVAHLILVQSTPMAIRFRDDEKQFDVDGAYNARYEIVKKRIDKATVKGSGERLTQPNSIAIVYSQAREAEEYRRFIDYLIAARYLKGDVEDLELEDLQGVNGLKALRVRVADTSPDSEFFVTPTGTVEAVPANGRR